MTIRHNEKSGLDDEPLCRASRDVIQNGKGIQPLTNNDSIKKIRSTVTGSRVNQTVSPAPDSIKK
jgi:hypothetical protein